MINEFMRPSGVISTLPLRRGDEFFAAFGPGNKLNSEAELGF